MTQLPPYLSREDIDQEMELLKLTGVARPSRFIVTQRLVSRKSTLPLADMPDTATSPWACHHTTPPETVEELIDWTLTKASDVQDLIWDFLEDPELEFDRTFKTLETLGYITSIKHPKPAGTSISQIILNALPATKEELIELVQAISPETDRPAATVRQNLRRLTKSNKIRVLADTTIERI